MASTDPLITYEKNNNSASSSSLNSGKDVEASSSKNATSDATADEDVHETDNTTTCQIINESFKEMFGKEVLLDYNFIVFAIGTFLMSLGFLAPYVYAKNRAVDIGIASDRAASYLISICGLGSTMGRLIFGALTDIECLHKSRLIFYVCMAALAGILQIFSIYIRSYWGMAVFVFT